MTLANSLGSDMCNPTRIINLCTARLIKYSLNSWTYQSVFLVAYSSSSLRGLALLKTMFPNEDWGKEGTKYFWVSMVFITAISHCSSVPHVSPSHLLLLYLQNSSLLPCTSLDRFYSILALAFLTLYLQDWKVILDLSWVNFILPWKSNN